MSDHIERCDCCGKVIQLIICIASGFDSATLIGWVPIEDDKQKAVFIYVAALISLFLAFFKLIIKESCLLCCKYYCMPWGLCCCNKKEIKSSKNIKSFWLSYCDVTFDFINAYLLFNGFEAGDTDILVVAGTAIGFGSEVLELISSLTACCSGSFQLLLALIQAIIGIVQGVIAQSKVDQSAKVAIYGSFYMYVMIIFSVLYAFCQINKAKNQAKTRKATAEAIQMGTVKI